MRYVALFVIVAVVMLAAQVTGPSQMTFAPLGASTGCVAATTGDVLCAANDGFYISVAGGIFQKINTGSPTPATTITCTTAALTTGSSGSFTASGCTIK